MLAGFDLSLPRFDFRGMDLAARADSNRPMINVAEGKYSIELFRPDSEGGGIETVLDCHDSLKMARAIYRGMMKQYPGRLIMLCDHARVLARSDRPDPMPP